MIIHANVELDRSEMSKSAEKFVTATTSFEMHILLSNGRSRACPYMD